MDKKRRKFPEEGLMLYRIIEASNLTVEEIAERMDVSTRTISYYETGERRITPQKLIKLLQITGTDIQKIEIP